MEHSNLELIKALLLALALGLPIAAWAVGFRRRRVFENQFGRSYISAAPRTKVSLVLSSSKLFIFVVASILLSSAILDSGSSERKISSSNKKKTLCLAIDVSRSMLAPAGQESRLARAKKSAEIIIGNTGFDCVSVVAFAGAASLALPPTSDFATARALVATLDPESFAPQGSSASRAIELAALSRADSSGYSACVVLSDGEFHDAADRARIEAAGLPVHCLQFGTEKAKIPLDSGGNAKDASGTEVISTPNPESLKEIAKWTSGSFLAVENYDAVVQFAKEALAVPTILDQGAAIDWRLLAAFVLLVGFLFVPEHRSGGVARAGTAAIAILAFAAVDSFGERDRPFDKGFSEYRNASYTLAADWFARAAETALDSSKLAICQYNQANAIYKSTLSTSADSAAQLLGMAIELYKQSLRACPSDSVAQYNLSMALSRLHRLGKGGSPKELSPASKKYESAPTSPARRLSAKDMKQLIQLAKRNSLRSGMSAGKKGAQSAGHLMKPW